jgi:acetylornithine/succinyldiaminopimelate/putrescine aminotransferase
VAISVHELGIAFARLREHPSLLAVEIAEFNPYRDADGKTAAVVFDLPAAVLGTVIQTEQSVVALEYRHGAHNFDPFPVVLAKDKGVYLWDDRGRRYLDMMSAYSAVRPVSAFLARRELMQVFQPGDHGSTFGGNPLGAAVALEALDIIVEERLAERSAELEYYLLMQLRGIRSPLIRDVRGLGLFIGVEIDSARSSARAICDRLMAGGILSKDTHGTVVRFAPPLTISRPQIDWSVERIRQVFDKLNTELRKVA